MAVLTEAISVEIVVVSSDLMLSVVCIITVVSNMMVLAVGVTIGVGAGVVVGNAKLLVEAMTVGVSNVALLDIKSAAVDVTISEFLLSVVGSLMGVVAKKVVNNSETIHQF